MTNPRVPRGIWDWHLRPRPPPKRHRCSGRSSDSCYEGKLCTHRRYRGRNNPKISRLPKVTPGQDRQSRTFQTNHFPRKTTGQGATRSISRNVDCSSSVSKRRLWPNHPGSHGERMRGADLTRRILAGHHRRRTPWFQRSGRRPRSNTNSPLKNSSIQTLSKWGAPDGNTWRKTTRSSAKPTH